MTSTIRLDQIAPVGGSAPPSADPLLLLQGPNGATGTGAAGASQAVPLGAKTEPGKPNSRRKDMESLYFALKTALSDRWNDYKSSITNFVMGRISQQELRKFLNPYIASNPAVLHYHNQLICAICYNCTRDQADVAVAPWVSANAKPSAGLKLTASDEFEQRLRMEVMQIPSRERHRIKEAKSEPFDPLVEAYASLRATREMHIPDVGTASSSKTNWEPEIRKRYTQPLAVEANDLPDLEALNSRITPICYEEGLPGGCANICSDFMDSALRSFLAGALTHLFQRTRSNGSEFVKTSKYAKRLEKEEELCARDELRRNADGLLPVQVEAISKRKPISLADLQMSIRMGDPFFGQVPLLAQRLLETGVSSDELEETSPVALAVEIGPAAIVGANPERALGTSTRVVSGSVHIPMLGNHNASFNMSRLETDMNSSIAVGRSFISGDEMDEDEDEDEDTSSEMAVDEDDFGWQGADMEDIAALNGVLDDCIAV